MANYVWDEKTKRYVMKKTEGAAKPASSGNYVSARVAANKQALANDVEWQGRSKTASIRAAAKDLTNKQRFEKYQSQLGEGLYKRGGSTGITKIVKDLGDYQQYHKTLMDNIDLFDFSDEEREELIGAANTGLEIANSYRNLARARTGDKSVLDGATGDQYKEYERLLNLSGYDQLDAKMQTPLLKEMQKQPTSVVDIPADYDFNVFGDDIFRAKYGEEKDGTKLTEEQRQMYKQRIETVAGIKDFDALSTSEQLNLTYDPDYLDQMQKMNSGAQTYQDVLDITQAYGNEDMATDAMTVRDYQEGHVQVSEDEYNRAKNRLSAIGGGFDLESLFGDLDNLDNYVKYAQAYASQARGDAEQAQFDDQIQQKYGQYQNAPDFAAKSQPIPLGREPQNEAEAIHEAIVSIDAPELYETPIKEGGMVDTIAGWLGIDRDKFTHTNTLADPNTGRPSAAQQKYNASTITPDQRKMFKYLWETHGQDAAMEYLNDIDWSVRKATAAKTEEVSEELSDGVLGGAAASIASVLASPARAVTTPINAARTAAGQEIDQYDPIFNVGRASDTIRKNVGGNLDELLGNANILGWNIGSGLYNAAMSAADSWMLYPFGASGAAAVMGLEASDSAMREALANGRTQGEALRDAGATAAIESITEKLPMETLFGDVVTPGKYFISNALAEMGEELTSEGLNMLYDTIAYGDESDLGKVVSELRTLGYAGKDLTLAMVKEVAGRMRDAGFGGLAGGGLGAAGRTVTSAAENASIKKNLSGNDAVKPMLNLAETLNLPEDIRSIVQDQLKAVSDGKKVSAAKIGRIFRETMKAVDEKTQSVLSASMSRNVAGMLRGVGVDDPAIAEAVTRVVADNGTASTEDYRAIATNAAALKMTEDLVARYDEGMEVQRKGEELAKQARGKVEKPAQVNNPPEAEEETEPASETDELTPEEMEAAGIQSDVQIDEQAAKEMVDAAAAEYGRNADIVAAAYEAGQDPVSFNQQFRQAYQYGEEGRNYDVISKSSTFSALNEQQIKKAYLMGRDVRVQRAQEAAKQPVGRVKVGNVDTSKIRGIRLNESQSKAVGAVTALAKAIGFNVEFFASTANADGKFTEKNGSWSKETRTISIDINAGRASTKDVNYAIMQTVGHELTHFIKSFADTDLFAQYQDFVMGHLSEKVSEKALDDTIQQYIKRWAENDAVLDRDGAIEEIVADASGDALLKLTEADLQQLAQSNPSLLKKIGDFIQRWVKNTKALIEKAYTGQTARNPIADQMVDAVDELGRKWAELLKNASANARDTAIQPETTPKKVNKNQPAKTGEFLAYGHIDQRTPESIRNTDTQLFCSEVEEAQGYYAAAATMLLYDAESSVSGQKFFMEDGVTGQKRMSSDFLAGMKDDTGWSWDKIRGMLQQFAAMAEGGSIKNTVTNREMELYLDEVLSNGYTTLDGTKVAPADDYIEAKNQYRGSAGKTAPKSAYDGAVDFMEYAFGGFDDDFNTKFSLRRTVEQTNTPEFRNWFKDSKIVNPDGTPKVMYHGSPNDFTVFDIKKARSSGLYGKGFYFTDSASHGNTYGKLYEVYLSIKNPLTPGGSTVTRTQVRKFLEAVAENEDDYSIENYGTYDVNEILRSVYRKDAFAVIQDVNATAIGDMVEAVKLFNEVNGTTFDGIVVDTETVAFEPTQIKSATDNIGTFDPHNPDIRYSVRGKADPDSDKLYRMNEELRAAQNELREVEQLERDAQNNPELLDAMTAIIEFTGSRFSAEGRARLRELKQAYKDIAEKLGINGLGDRKSEIESRIREIRQNMVAFEGELAQRRERQAIEKSGLSEADYFKKRAVKEFGYTTMFVDAGYLLPDGKMLNFSGEKGKHFGVRGQDHRAIGVIYEATSGHKALTRFMNDGNIRVMAEAPGVDLTNRVEPTAQQYLKIKAMVREYADKHFFNVDISDENGVVVGSYTYDGKVNADRVVNDIKYYFETGTFREQSRLSEFLDYQLRDPDQISDRELLANVMETAATNEVELDFVRRYRKQLDQLDQKQADMDAAHAEMIAARKAGKKDEAIKLKNKVDILAKQIDRMDGQLLKFEAGKPLQAVVKRQREQLREKANERIKKRVEKVRQQEAEKRDELRARIDTLRQEKNRKIEQLRREKTDAVTRVRDEKNESFARQKYLDEVKKSAGKLREMVTSPTNKKHVPQVLRQPIADFLTTLDFTSAQQLSGGEATKADNQLENAMLKMKDALQKVQNSQNGLDTSGAEYFSGYLDLPAGYAETFDQIIGKVRAAIAASDGINGTPINRMKSADLHELAKHLRMLHTAINNMNNLIANAKYATAIAASQDTIVDLESIKAKKDQNTLFQKLSDFIDWKNSVPYYAFQRMGRGGKAIFEALMDGWDKLAFNAEELVKFTESVYNAKEVKAWESEIKTVELESGESVRMTAAQLMSLYCLAKREQAMGHLMGGGIRIADIEAKRGKRIAQGENYILSEGDISKFRDALTDRQREVADALQADMVKRGGDWGNEISMRRFGYDMFTEANYFPVESDSNNLKAKDPNAQENSLLRLLNMSATKDLVKGANNAIVVRSIFDVYTAHMSDMAKYNALGLQILDMMKWLNYVERTEEVDANGNSTGKITTESVQKSLELAYGTEARRYIMEFIKNLNGEVEGGREDGIINKFTSNYKIAAVGANLRVGFQQITSLPRAAVAIDSKYLLAGIAKWNARKGKVSAQAVEKVGIAKWKSMGFYDTNISRNMRQMIKHDEAAIDKVRDGSMKLAEWGDAWTMGVLYGAVESELMSQGKKPGDSTWDAMVNKRLREIVYRTQVVDSTMTRSHLMRQKGGISGALAFMSEPTLALNMLNDALFESRMNIRAGVKWNPATVKKVAKVFAVSAAVNVLSAFVEAAFTAMRDDDEFETIAEKYLDALRGDYSDAETYGDKLSAFFGSALGGKLNPLSNIPVISDMIDAWKSGAAEQMWQVFAGEMGEGFRALMKVMREGGTLADYYRAGYKMLSGLSKAGGIPANNAVRDAAGLYNTFAAERMGWRRLQTYDNTESEAAAAILEAKIAGDDEKVKKIRERTAIYHMDDEKIEKSLATRAKDAYLKGLLTKTDADKLMVSDGGMRARDADEALTEADYQIATGLKHSDMKDDFIAGTITEKQARDYLKKYDGLREDEIDDKINLWKYEKDTGYVYSEMKADFIDGELTESQVKNYRVKYGGSDSDAVEETLGHWKYERDTGLAWSDMEDDYADGVISESQARSYLAKYGGKDEEKVEEKISNFDYHIATGRSTTAPKYWRIAYAFDSGADYGAYIDEAFETIMHGGEKRRSWKEARSQIASSLASYYKNQYLAARGTAAGDAMLERILDLYEAIGYDRNYERKYIAENWVED